jgi:HK97 family phage prohead protease
MRNSVYESERHLVTKLLAGSIAADKVGDRQIRVIVSTPGSDRVGDVMEPMGCDLKAYRRNPVVLLNHDRTKPIGTAVVEIKSDRVEATITFAPAGVCDEADEACSMAKAGVLNAVSPGFIIKEASPIKGGGSRITKWELLEISLVTVPANPDAVVTQRSLDPDTEHRRREIEILGLKAAPAVDCGGTHSPAEEAAQRNRELAGLKERGKQQERHAQLAAMSTPAGAAHVLHKQEEERSLSASRLYYDANHGGRR